ncbi:O-antigen ligase family protein [Adlercreutzia muris]|uniref:O-antigen ligase family protein n=1 Tax=Adlercreutzia muris TaxID=1796610 RepID=UPI0021D581AB|nr:O-antigen ligase family protein [Adlercreutzia muris]MCU7584833.1 O-antigen ligase family protein [Adlercreutzia muris]
MPYRPLSRRDVLRTPIPWGALLFFLLMVPHFKTAYIDTFASADLLFNIARIGSMLITIVLYVVKGHRADARVGVLVLFEMLLLLSTLVNEGSVVTFVSTYGLGLGVYLLVDLYSDSPRAVVAGIFFVGEVLVYLNLAAMILVPDGLYVSKLLGFYHNWVLGYKNQFLPFFICFATVAFLQMRYTGKRLRSVVLIAAMILSLILGRSATSLIVMVLFVFGMLIAETRAKFIFNPYLLAGVIVGAFFVIVLMSSSETISGLIASIANRDVTFSGRTIIWSSVMDAIAQKPLFGWGVLTDEAHIALIDYAEASTAHNFYLELLLSGGLVSFVAFLLFLILVLKKVKSCEGFYASKLFAAALFALGLAYMTEAYSNPILFALFAFAANADKYAQNEKSRRLGALSRNEGALHSDSPLATM